MVVKHSRQQVVGSSDGVEVACKMKVDILHRNNLRISSAGSPALNSKNRSQGRFSHGNHGLLIQAVQGVCQTDGHGCLALTCGCGVDGCHQHQLCIRSVL